MLKLYLSTPEIRSKPEIFLYRIWVVTIPLISLVVSDRLREMLQISEQYSFMAVLALQE